MASSRLMQGILIILFVLIVNVISAFIVSDVAASGGLEGCATNSNSTQCESYGKTDFLSTVLSTTFTGFPDAPLIVNAIWGTLMVTLLTTAVLLIVLAFIPLTNS